MEEFEAYQARKLTNMLKEIKLLFEHEYQEAQQRLVESGNFVDGNSDSDKVKFIQYLQDQFDKLTEGVKW
jgi:hypothetical protein